MICIIGKEQQQQIQRSLKLKQAAYIYQNIKKYIYILFTQSFNHTNQFFIQEYVSRTGDKYFR